MPHQPKRPTDYVAPTVTSVEPPIETRVALLEIALVRLHARLEEVIAAQVQATDTLGALHRLLADIARLGEEHR